MFFDASCVFMQVKFEVDFSRRFELAVFWVSLKFEERSEAIANFPLTLNNFFTSCARWHKILSEQTYLLSIFTRNLSFKISDTAPFLTSMDLFLAY